MQLKVVTDKTEHIPLRKKPNRLVIQLSGNYGTLLSVFIFLQYKTKTKPLLIFLKTVHKVVHIIHRLMANCVYQEGAVTPIQDIKDHAEQRKENNSGSYLIQLNLLM